MATIDLYEVGQTIDQYKIIRLIANTQNSHVYLVEASGLHKHLVLKLFASELTPNTVKQFVDQTNLLLEFLQHPHIAKVLHVGLTNERPYMVMPYYPQTLNNLLAVHYQKLSFLTSLGIIKQVLLAVQSLHHLGIVHLDIKPQNIYLDEGNSVCLGDFDNALVLNTSPLFSQFQEFANNSNERQNEGLGYTPEYASPEQINHLSQSSPIDESSDLYSIGALWFRMLVGETLSNRVAKQTNNDHSATLINNELKAIAPDWAVQVITNLLSESALNRPTCSSCLIQIDYNVQTPHNNQTVQADAIQMPAVVSKLQQEIKHILLVDGWVSSREITRLLATHKLVDIKSSENGSELSQRQLQDSLQDLIEESERQLIEDNDLSAWFGWVNYVRVLLEKSSTRISTEQYRQLLKVGRDSRPDKPGVAEALLRKHFQSKKMSLNVLTRYVLPVLIIVLVIFYWLQTEPDSFSSSEHTPEFISATSHDIIDTFETPSSVANIAIENPQEFTNEAPDIPTKPAQAISHVSDNVSALTGTYNFVAELGNAESTINVDWVRLTILPNVRIMSTEVTNSLYSLCIKEGACRQTKKFSTALKYSDENKANDKAEYPKINISWYEITEQFIPWINQRTSKMFSLPSYQQWEVFSQSAINGKAVVHCKNCNHPLTSQYTNSTMPVSAINADLYGMYHVYGNAQEWLSNCWQQVSRDGQQVDRCDQAMVAGGSWMSKSSDYQEQPIIQLLKTAKTPTTGFRLVELLNE